MVAFVDTPEVPEAGAIPVTEKAAGAAGLVGVLRIAFPQPVSSTKENETEETRRLNRALMESIGKVTVS